MANKLKLALGLAAALFLGGCTVIGVATTVVGVGVGVGGEIAETGVHVGVGATTRAADLLIPDREPCEPGDDEYPEDEEECGTE